MLHLRALGAHPLRRGGRRWLRGHHPAAGDAWGAALAGAQPKPLVAGPTGCLCPGWVTGELPRAMTKHLDYLGYEWWELSDPAWDGGPCTSCEHVLAEHAELVGCTLCPCSVDEVVYDAGPCPSCAHAVAVHDVDGCTRCSCTL